jgi:hypothetical protein
VKTHQQNRLINQTKKTKQKAHRLKVKRQEQSKRKRVNQGKENN